MENNKILIGRTFLILSVPFNVTGFTKPGYGSGFLGFAMVAAGLMWLLSARAR